MSPARLSPRRRDLLKKKIAIIVAAAGFCLAIGCADREVVNKSPEDEAVRVIGRQVEFRKARNRVEAVGTARARQAATIYPETEGEVTAIEFEPGDLVAKGDVLATLEDVEERLAVSQAQVTLAEAEQLLGRYERIDVAGAVSESQIDSARTAVEAAEIDLRLAREALDQRRVRAPFAGHVGIAEVDAGARITSQTTITQLDARDVLFVDFEAPEELFGRIEVGEILRLLPFSNSGAAVEAKVRTLGSRVDPQRRLFMVRTEVDNSDDRFRPGMSFRVEFDAPGKAYPVAPEAAIVWGGDGPYLWAVRDGAARRMPVSIVGRETGFALVDAPLEEGDVIVAEGVQKVREGARVDIIETETRGAGAGPVSATTGIGGSDRSLDQ